MKKEILNQDITLGPLHYRLHAHDDWAADLLIRMTERVACQSFSGPAHRHVHIVRQPIAPAATDAFEAGILMPELAALVPEDLPANGWQITGNNTTHLTWRHPDSNHAFWTNSCKIPLTELPFQCPFHLPLDLIFHDIVALGGGIVHGGLAVYKGHGILLTAPPGGGKTTAFSTTPENWLIEADDATLVWPETDESFRVSPLPTWSVLLGVNPQLERIKQWQVGNSYPLKIVLLLEKSETIIFTSQRPLNATLPLYQAFSEYPIVIVGRAPYRTALFRAASTLARTVPIWSLELTRKGNFWPHIEEELAYGVG